MLNSTIMRYIILSVFLFGSYLGKAQTNLNDYKYIVVPKKFEDFNKENQYQTSTLIKHLFSKKGFTAVWEDKLPEDLAMNRCQALFVALRDKSSMFKTKTTIVLNDCNKQEIFATSEGNSKQKDYKLSYTEAITEAMKSFDGLQYKYNGKSEINEPITVSFKNDVKKLDEEQKTSVKPKNQDNSVVVQEATTERQTYKSIGPKESDYKKAEKSVPVVEQKTTREEQSFKTMEPVSTDIKKPEVEKAESKVLTTGVDITLYAQKLQNGFQLVDSTPKITMRIYNTSVQGYFIAQKESTSGILINKNGKWVFEYYEGDTLMSEEIDIKF